MVRASRDDPGKTRRTRIHIADDSHHGLAAYVLTDDIGSSLRTAHAIESGWVPVPESRAGAGPCL